MPYSGNIELIAGIKPKNNGNFPLVNAKDVYISDDDTLESRLLKLNGTFINKGVFMSQDDLLNDYSTGDILTYINEVNTNLLFEHLLTGTDFEEIQEYDFDNMHVVEAVTYFSDLPITANINDVYLVNKDTDDNEINIYYKYNGLEWNEVNKDIYWKYVFSLENAHFLAQYKSKINTIKYNDLGKLCHIDIKYDAYITLFVFTVTENELICKIKKDTLIANIRNDLSNSPVDNLTPEEIDTIIEYAITNIFNKIINEAQLEQNMNLSYKDKIFKLSNGWDKLISNPNNQGIEVIRLG